MPVLITNGNTTLSQVVTMTIANPCVATYGVALADQKPITFATTGALPTGLVAGTTYYVKDPVGLTFNVAATPGGAAIETTGTQSGVHTISNAFYRVEAYNLGCYSSGGLDLDTERTIAVTFANAGNCKGIVLPIRLYHYNGDRSIIVHLEKNDGGWADVAGATITITSDQITNSCTKKNGYYMVAFTLGTPTSVTTAPSTWRFKVQQTGGTTGTYQLMTSDATNPFYAAWCDNPVSFSDNDTVIVKDYLTINKTATFRGVLGTGDTVNSTACVVCTNMADTTPDNVCYLMWENPPVSAYTLTLDGYLVLAAYSGFRCGTSTQAIPVTQAATITIQYTPTYGSAGRSGFSGLGRELVYTRKMSLFFYGSIPTFERTTLAADAAATQPNIVTTDTTGWANGDTVFVGKADRIGLGNYTVTTISNIVGTAIQLSSNLTYKALSGGQVVRVNGYGINIQSSAASLVIHYLVNPSNLKMSGVRFYYNRFYFAMGNYTAFDDATRRSLFEVKHCSVWNGTAAIFLYSITPNEDGLEVQYVNDIGGTILVLHYHSTVSNINTGLSGKLTFSHNVTLSCNGIYFSPNAAADWEISDNIWENGSTSTSAPMVTLQCVNGTFTDNKFYGVSGAAGAAGTIEVKAAIGLISSGNHFDRNGVAILFTPTSCKDVTFTDEVFGAEYVNTIDIDFYPGALLDAKFVRPIGMTVSTTYLTQSVEGSMLRIVDDGGTPNVDMTYMTYGKITRVGDGLGDTTVRTSGTGKFAMRFEPYHATQSMVWKQIIPTGNIQNKTMNVNVWVKINNLAYYAATHTKPTLRVKYDNATEITAVALGNTDWQQLNLSFTPLTTYGQIEVSIEGATDALTTSKYFYVDDMNVAYPAGVQVDLGGLDLWANGLPVVPAIATMPSLAGVWDEATAAHTAAGSFAKLVKDYLDATVSSRSSHSAADIWSVGARTLTSFGSLIADIWSYVTRILTGATNITSDAGVIDQSKVANLDVPLSSVKSETDKIQEIYELYGLDLTKPLIVSKTERQAGAIHQRIDEVGDTVIVTRES